MLTRKVVIVNKLGLHARAAAKLVALASKFDSAIMLGNTNRQVNGKSIMGVMMLAAAKGSTLELIIDGPDETQALAALEQLIADKFGEEA